MRSFLSPAFPRAPGHLAWLALLPLLAAYPAAARDLAADRPDVTESPVPVERGRWQLEADVVGYGRTASGTNERVEVLSVVLKRGIARASDVQVVLQPWQAGRTGGGAGGSAWDREPRVGVGVRFKQGVFGTDGGAWALGLLPWTLLPAGPGAAAERWQAGVAIPVAIPLPAGFGLGVMLEGAAVSAGGARHALAWTGSCTASHTIFGALGGFAELVATSPPDRARWAASLANAGLTLALGPDAQADAGLRRGLGDAERDLDFWLGLTVRR